MSLTIEAFLECKDSSRGTAFYGDNKSTWESDYETIKFEFSNNNREDRLLTLIDDENQFNELQAGKKYRVTFEEIQETPVQTHCNAWIGFSKISSCYNPLPCLEHPKGTNNAIR